MPNPFFSGRIPQDLDDRIKEYCAETGENKTQLLINALSTYLNHPIKPQPRNLVVSIEMFEELERRVAELEEKVMITDVIKRDNNSNATEQADNNLITNNIDNQETQQASNDSTQLSILGTKEWEAEKLDQDNHKLQIVKTNEVTDLPGLESMDKEKVSQKLRNAKANGKAEVSIGQYILKYYGKEEGTRGLLLWEVITGDNK